MDTEHVRFMAAAAVAFTKRYNSQLLQETSRSTGLIHGFSQARIKLIESDGTYPKAHMLPGSEWVVIHLGDSQDTFLLNPVTMESHNLAIGKRFHGCASHELEDPKQIVLVVHSSHELTNKPCQLHLFVLTFTEDRSSLDEDHECFEYSEIASDDGTLFLKRIEKRWTFEFPRDTLDSNCLVINESYIVIPGWERRVLLINWKEETGCWIGPHEEEDSYHEDINYGWELPYFYLGFHSSPSGPTLLLGLKRFSPQPKPYKIEILALEADLPTLEEGVSTIRFIPTTLLYAFAEEPECGNILFTGQGPIFELLTIPPLNSEGMRVAFSRSRILDNPALPIHHKFLRPDGPWQAESPLRGPKNTSCSIRTYTDKKLYICNTRNLNLHSPDWVRLETLFFGEEGPHPFHYEEICPLAFDPLHGRLIVYYRGIWCLRF
ncbi:hypothetical protein SISSUDRAFT_1056261 [Sistotremastrum suecicum HHB10207 ss-3]|uniref:Uncharacterized protein n=1 Tax=Sistotremastrum suecicum HHB10207 ss-3 TaxID=1314776 RepID=A0A165X2Z2_9AGAM|nr:hypothetical protein SISSUDRAFT_1056261 [Sistotremastrum suecicum HHB10207 ss-3]